MVKFCGQYSFKLLGLMNVSVNNDIEVLIGSVDICEIIIESVFLKAPIALLPLKIPFQIMCESGRSSAKKPDVNAHFLSCFSDVIKLNYFWSFFFEISIKFLGCDFRSTGTQGAPAFLPIG